MVWRKRDGYCNCADCRADQEKRRQVKRHGRLQSEPAPPRPDMEHFWDEVHKASELRDDVRRSRR